MKIRRLPLLPVASLAVGLCLVPFAGRGADLKPEESAFFEAKVRPLLVKHCYECHSRDAEKIKGGLVLDTREGWMAGGDSGEVIEPGKPEKSLLVETIHHG
ncbi:MAG: hypothetical protein KDM91_04475, partial [Verrucomicrobiae bacterium]|nr:hypothetical protein [Verrucomicrobiae bacterium]